MRKTVALLAILSMSATASAWRAKPGPVPKVTRITPRHGSAFVPLRTKVTIAFNRTIDLASVTPATVELRRLAGGSVPVTYALEAHGRRLVLTPTAQLEVGIDYQVVVRPGVLTAPVGRRILGGRTIRKERRTLFFSDSRVPQFPRVRSEQFQDLASTMSEGREGHTGTLMPDGRVLLAAGMIDYSNYAEGADIFDPVSDTFAPSSGLLKSARVDHCAVRRSGGVLLIGGSNAAGPLASTEFFDESTDSFSVGPALLEQRDFTAAVTLKDGRILVTGGFRYIGGRPTYLATAEVLDLFSTSFRSTKLPPNYPRAGHTATVLSDGRVFLIGGDSQSLGPTAEIFDPETESFSLAASPSLRRQSHTATLLPDSGLVLVSGGGELTPQIFDPGNGAFRFLASTGTSNRLGATATATHHGLVLFAGGSLTFGEEKFALDAINLFLPDDGGTMTETNIHFAEPRFGHTATTLRDDRVLFAGGVGTADPASLRSAVVFTPDPE